MKCCLCKKKIDVRRTWAAGHNAQPLKEGRCCTNCNNAKVIPARFNLYFKKKKSAI